MLSLGVSLQFKYSISMYYNHEKATVILRAVPENTLF